METVPSWQFWHPLPLWQALVIAFAIHVVIVVPVAMLSGGLELGIPIWLTSGIASVVWYFALRRLALRKLAEGDSSKP